MPRFLLQFLLLISGIEAHLRFCQAAGSCRQCSDKRYSYYRCRVQADCFTGETCDGGFCCPSPQTSHFAHQNDTDLEPTFPQPHRLFLTHNTVSQSNDLEEKCPDGSDWVTRCSTDNQCSADTVCAQGKCCAVCAQRRRLFLDKLAASEVMGKAIPQCESDGRLYRKKQCLAGTDKCWCVTKYGEKQEESEWNCEVKRRKQMNLAVKAVLVRNEMRRKSTNSCAVSRTGSCPRIRPSSDSSSMVCYCDEDCYGTKKCCPLEGTNVCTTPVSPHATTLLCGANEQFSACHSPCQGSCGDPTVLPCPSPTCQPGCQCQPGFLRRDGSQHSPCVSRVSCAQYDVTTHCSDERRQYQGCGSACPVSCQNRNVPRCHERCVSGCFCRVPYILENGEDPLHSRCVLPTECPSSVLPSPVIPTVGYSMRNTFARFPITPNQGYNPYQQYYPTPQSPSVVPRTNRCADPLKNFISCGTLCPVGCNALAPSVSCSLQCVPGCFCRAPYILKDAKDPQSACVLPQNCPSHSVSKTSCTDPRKEWSECGAFDCARSCSNLLGRCASGQCSAGCICREPYVLQNSLDPASRCVLPSECERDCQDPMKEFVTCGSSCPMGCDNRHPMSCTPCQTGCYCKNGLVLLNSTDWQTSKCVRIEDCPAPMGDEMTSSGMTSSTTTTTTSPSTTESSTTTVEPKTTTKAPAELTTTTEAPQTTVAEKENGLMIEKTLKSEGVDGLSGQCPATTLDVGGRSCNRDTDCPVEQRCCRALIATLGVNPQRCSCPDPLAVWNSCGSLCPEYCGQPAVPVCSSTCNPGCQCASGYVRVRNDVTAPCIPREACSHVLAENLESTDSRHAIMREIPFAESVDERLLATANLDGKPVTGEYFFTRTNGNKLKITGNITGLSTGSHAIVLHQYGDISSGCTRIGPPLRFRNNAETASLGDLQVSKGGVANFSRLVDWPIDDVIGRSIAIYRFSTAEWSAQVHEENPLACGTIGLAN